MTDNAPEQNGKAESWFGQLLRKRVFQTLAIYIAIAWGGTEILLAVQETLGFPEWIARLAMALFIAGIPVAGFLAWAHDLKSRSIRIFLRSAAIVILVAGAMLVFQQSRAPGPPEASLAVLPFLDMSPDADQGWLVGALAEDLRNTLAQAGGLLVIASASSEVFQGRAGELDEIREKLNVRHILEGSIRQDAGILRITANLIDTLTGRHVWSDRYDLPAENIFDVEDRIVDQITGSLSVTLAPEVGEGGTRSLAAFEAYQRARESESPESAYFNYEEALRIDPEFAWPLLEMAALHYHQLENHFVSPPEAWNEAAPLLERATQINEAIPEIHLIYGLLHTDLGNIEEAESSYQRAIELNPNLALAYGAYGLLMRWHLGRYEDAVILHERNVQVDPLDYTAIMQLGTSYWTVDRYDEARAQYEKALRICPACGMAYVSYSAMLSARLGRVDEALEVLYRGYANADGDPNPRQLAITAAWHRKLGDERTAAQYTKAMESLMPGSPPALESAAERDLSEGNFSNARQFAESRLARNPRDLWAVEFLARIDLEEGQPQYALERYRAAAPGLFESPLRMPGAADPSDLPAGLWRALSATGQTETLQRILEAQESSGDAQAIPLLYAGRLKEAIAKIRGHPPNGVIDPELCRSLQDELPWLPPAIDPEDPDLQALIRDACTERERQLANVRRKLESGEFRIPGAVLEANQQ
jgi:TolB-like protein/tetratricopeptide (TPR) repeat protein